MSGRRHRRDGRGAVRASLKAPLPAYTEDMVKLRHEYLVRQLSSMRARIQIVNGKKMSFDEESKAIYDVVAPTKSDAEFQKTIDQLNEALPGNGSLIERYDSNSLTDSVSSGSELKKEPAAGAINPMVGDCQLARTSAC